MKMVALDSDRPPLSDGPKIVAENEKDGSGPAR